MSARVALVDSGGTNIGSVSYALERLGATARLTADRAEILAADPYETATALSQTEASLQNLYALTSRLSRLSLTDYL